MQYVKGEIPMPGTAWVSLTHDEPIDASRSYTGGINAASRP